jgi:hypothetical protein
MFGGNGFQEEGGQGLGSVNAREREALAASRVGTPPLFGGGGAGESEGALSLRKRGAGRSTKSVMWPEEEEQLQSVRWFKKVGIAWTWI